ncbi:sulfate transporter, partial [Trifolium medium]|nr:sulfate transporter [Trifolium medium]
GDGKAEEGKKKLGTVEGSMGEIVIAPRLLNPSLVRVYRSSEDDVMWAHKRVVATVINGETVALVQEKIEDVGFNNLKIIPLGADKVL